jgi:hypothetical protein
MKYLTPLLLSILAASASGYGLRCVSCPEGSDPIPVVPDDHDIINLGPGNFDCCHPPTEEELRLYNTPPTVEKRATGDWINLGRDNVYRVPGPEDLLAPEAPAVPLREVEHFNLGADPGHRDFFPSPEQIERGMAMAAEAAAKEAAVAAQEGKVAKVFVA